MISLAGGLPAAELMPRSALAAALASCEHHGVDPWQYGPSAGEPALIDRIADEEAGQDRRADPSEIVVTTGSQQALGLVAMVSTRPGDTVVIEEPGYVGALQVFRQHGLHPTGVAVDRDGLDVERLASQLEAGLRPRLCYVNPTFQNPTGAVLTPARASALIDLAEHYGFLIVADDPYRMLGFYRAVAAAADPGPTARILHPHTSSRVVRLGSSSKTIAPGLRVGWSVAAEDVTERIVLAKQGADLHTPTLNQLVVADQLADGDAWSRRIGSLRAAYRDRADALTAAVSDGVGRALGDVAIERPRGGFFLWLDDLGVDTTAGLERALAHGVAYVPGSAFGTGGAAARSLRLSFSSGDPATFAEGVRRLVDALSRS